MKKDDIISRLEGLKTQDVNPPAADQTKLAIISSKKSLNVSLWLMSIPTLMLLTAIIESLFHVLLPPWSLLRAYGRLGPVWLRVTIFTTIVIILPITALILNLLAVVWISYNRQQKVLNISVRLKTANMIVLLIAGLIAFLFIGHTIADYLAGHD